MAFIAQIILGLGFYFFLKAIDAPNYLCIITAITWVLIIECIALVNKRG